MARTVPVPRLLALALLGAACSEQGFRGQETPAGGQPGVEVTPAALALGPLGGGEQASAWLRVASVGDADLRVEDVALRAAVEGLTLRAPALPAVLPPGATLEVEVVFDAHVTLAEGEIEVGSDDPGQPTVEVPVRATAEMAWLVLDPDPLDLGTVEPGESRGGSLSLANVGNQPLQVDQVLLLADAVSLDAPPALPVVLEPGAALAVPVTFAPLTRGEEAAQLWVESSSWLGDEMASITGRGGWEGVTGRICDPSGAGWVVDARVFADIDQDGDGVVDWTPEARTDAEGRFQLLDVPPGTWRLEVEKGSYRAEEPIEVPAVEGPYALPEAVCLDPDSARLAVVTGDYDHIQDIIGTLGLAADLYEGPVGLTTLLADPERLRGYDVLFLNCGDYRALEPLRGEVGAALARYVAEGGSVYASDWAALVLEAAWPDLVELHGADEVFEGTAIGMAGELEVEVLDLVMAYAIGAEQAELLYDLDAWVVPTGAGAEAEVLVSGTVPTFAGVLEDAPLLVRAEPGGRVIFTTFHNAQQITADMEAALREIILSL